jgi:hypothetical protein
MYLIEFEGKTTENKNINHQRRIFFGLYFGGLECVGHTFDYVAHFVFLRDVWNGTQKATVASSCATHFHKKLMH